MNIKVLETAERGYSRPEINEVNLSVEGGFCLSSQLKDFEENRIYTEEF